jgi:hypothetical protein
MNTMPNVHTYLLSINQEVYSDVESQDRNFNKFNDLFNFIIIFDEKQNQNKGKVSPLQILALTELLGKFILLSKDIQTVLVKLDRNKDKTADIYDEKNTD